MTTIAEGNARLLDVAKACRESLNPEKFTMRIFGHHCGTPACAFGHYAAREDLQQIVTLTKAGNVAMVDGCRDAISSDWDDLEDWFAIDGTEFEDLFDFDGCGGAQTPIQAAKYIESFVVARSCEIPLTPQMARDFADWVAEARDVESTADQPERAP